MEQSEAYSTSAREAEGIARKARLALARAERRENIAAQVLGHVVGALMMAIHDGRPVGDPDDAMQATVQLVMEYTNAMIAELDK